jgi:hypothetical protein
MRLLIPSTALYASGGRFFVLLNVAPLNLAPRCMPTTPFHGSGPNHYWPDMPANKTQIADVMMHEYVTTVNNVYKYQTPFEVLGCEAVTLVRSLRCSMCGS